MVGAWGIAASGPSEVRASTALSLTSASASVSVAARDSETTSGMRGASLKLANASQAASLTSADSSSSNPATEATCSSSSPWPPMRARAESATRRTDSSSSSKRSTSSPEACSEASEPRSPSTSQAARRRFVSSCSRCSMITGMFRFMLTAEEVVFTLAMWKIGFDAVEEDEAVSPEPVRCMGLTLPISAPEGACPAATEVRLLRIEPLLARTGGRSH